MSKDKKDNKFPNSRSTGDLIHATAKSILAFVPPAGELFQFVVQPPLEKRRNKWSHIVDERLQALEEKGIDLSQLQQNEQFISAVLQATQIALRTHQSEKLAALKNVINNLGQGLSVDDTVLFILLSHVDTLSEMHLRTLRLVHEPKLSPEMLESKDFAHWSTMVEYNIPELRGHHTITANQLLFDLKLRGLVALSDVEIGTEQGIPIKDMAQPHHFTTDLGKSLLRLIALD